MENELTISQERAAKNGLVSITRPFRGLDLALAHSAAALIRRNGGDAWLIISPEGAEVARPAPQVNGLLRRAHALGLDCNGPASAIPQPAAAPRQRRSRFAVAVA